MEAMMEEKRQGQVYFSRKNTVYRCERDGEAVIVKEMADPHAYWREKTIYEGLREKGWLLCPELLEAQDDHHRFIMEYIPGETVLQALEAAEKSRDLGQAVVIAQKLVTWLQEFHQSQKSLNGEMTMGDINFRNFLWSEGRIYGIDFEDCTFGSGRTELINLPAFYLLYDPADTPFKKKVVEAMIREIQNYTTWTEPHLRNEIRERKKEILRRRNGKTPPACR